MDYQKGKIYKIESHVGPKIYIGATIKNRLSQRMASHRADYKYWKSGKCTKTTSYDLFDEYGVENCKIVLLESCPCNNKDELASKEAEYIRKFDCVNKVIPDRTSQEYRKQYYIDNKEEINEYKKTYREINKDKIKEQKSVPFKCDCGSCFRIDDKARHERTKKHLNYLASKTE
jgi:hypothetical protein